MVSAVSGTIRLLPERKGAAVGTNLEGLEFGSNPECVGLQGMV